MNIITMEKRNQVVKAKQLVRSGIVPCIIYGGGLNESIPVQIDQATASKLFRLKREGSKIKLQIDDKVIPVQIKEKTRNFMNDEITHISFQALKSDQKVNSVAHIILQNADKIAEVLETMLIEVPYSALPEDMIDTVTIDLEGMSVGSILTVGDISEFKSEKVELQVDADSMVLRVSERKSLATKEA